MVLTGVVSDHSIYNFFIMNTPIDKKPPCITNANAGRSLFYQAFTTILLSENPSDA